MLMQQDFWQRKNLRPVQVRRHPRPFALRPCLLTGHNRGESQNCHHLRIHRVSLREFISSFALDARVGVKLLTITNKRALAVY